MTQIPKYPWGTDRRFNAWVEYMRQQFGGRVQKLALDAGFTCPNRDGSKGTGGCTFCSNDAFNPSYCTPVKSIDRQLEEGIEFHRGRYAKSGSYLAYFQAYSNTYASTDHLRSMYSEALAHPLVKGLVIGTRPDCIPDEILELLVELSESAFVHIELGIESLHGPTLKRINRGHSVSDSIDAIRRCAGIGLPPGIHMILGLPGETRELMLEQARLISSLPVGSLKLHQLQIIRGTAMEKEYLDDNSDFFNFTLDSYIDLVIDFLELLRPDIRIERFAGEVPPRYRLNEGWGNIRYERIIQLFEARLEERSTWQGKNLSAGQRQIQTPLLLP